MKYGALFRLAIIAAAALTAACGGGGGAGRAVPALPHATSAAPGSPTVLLTVSIPARSAADRMRHPSYLSANTQSVAGFVGAATPSPAPSGSATPTAAPSGTPTPVPSMTPSAMPSGTPAATVTANVTPSSPNCTTVASVATCTVTVPAPAGSDVFTVIMYSGLNGTGNVLSAATVNATVNANATNVVPIALAGLPATIALAPLPVVPAGMPTSIPLAVTVKDASGATIVGNDPFLAPITLADSDTSGSTSLTTTTLTTPSTTVKLNYTGTYVANAVKISASSPVVAAPSITNASFFNRAGHLYVGDHNSPNVWIYPASSTGTPSPTAFESTHVSTLQQANEVVAGLAFDSGNNLYVLYNLSDTVQYPTPTSEIAVFSPVIAGGAAATPVTPLRTIAGGATLLDIGSSDVAVDGAGHLYVDGSGTNTILVFAAAASGNVAPAYQLNTAVGGIAVRPDGTLFVTPSGTMVNSYAPGASGATAPVGSVAVTSGGVLALDAAGNLYHGCSGPCNTLTEFSYSGNTFATINTITNNSFYNAAPLAVDQAGYVYIANEQPNNQIFVYAPGATGAATPVQTITTSGGILPGQLAVGP